MVLIFLVICSTVYQFESSYIIKDTIMNHSFLFVSGWPQSGTSLVHQMVSLIPNSSTMVEKCEEKLGSRCLNWNHEGQWLLRGDGRKILNSGTMYTRNSVWSVEEKTMIIDQWSSFWSLDRELLIEKSPQSFIKIPLLRDTFGDAKSLKFIIVIKHPVTLNIAIPNGWSWGYKTSQKKNSKSFAKGSNIESSNTKDEMMIREPLEKHELVESVAYFIKFMTHNSVANQSLGWLPAMETLQQQLHNQTVHNLSNPSHRDVLILRYEQMRTPYKTCQGTMKFLFGSNSSSYLNALNEVCHQYLPRYTSTHATSIAIDKTHNQISTKKISPGNRNLLMQSVANDSNLNESRLLRLKIVKDLTSSIKENKVLLSKRGKVIDFQPEVVSRSGMERFAEFQKVWLIVKKIRPDWIPVMDNIDKRLNRFGYCLNRWYPQDNVVLSVRNKVNSVFDGWDVSHYL